VTATRFLADTHALLWWSNGDPRLSTRARDLILDPDVEILASAVSAWEIAIKAGLGALTLPSTPDDFMRDLLSTSQMKPLPIDVRHAVRVFDLPPLHKDPFDRLLIAQAIVENVPLITNDQLIARYPVAVEW
jgi:PIN domain nuclease of toxin-antitoxin system